MTKVLITGGAGFMGHHLVEHLIKNTNYNILIMDKLTYASMGFQRLKDVNCYENSRIKLFTYDFTNSIPNEMIKELGEIKYIIHLGAETHVDNSITDPLPFIKSNVIGTYQILELARKLPSLEKMLYFSTDEVFGPADKLKVPNGFKEWDRYKSSNPYAASKAGGEELCIAYENTYKIPVVITHTMNIFGERQHPEKFIPKIVNTALSGEKLYIHADATKKIPGSRFWIHARNVSAAVLYLLYTGFSGEKYNIVGEKEINNLDLALLISKFMSKTLNYELVDFHSSRPGHDLRYGLDGNKLNCMGFQYPLDFEKSLHKTIDWITDSENVRWLK